MDNSPETPGDKLGQLADAMLQDQAILIAGVIAELIRQIARLQNDVIDKIGKVSKRLGTLIDRRQEEVRLLLRSVAEEAMIKGVH